MVTSMKRPSRLARLRKPALRCAVTLLFIAAIAARVSAEEPAPDRTGAFQLTPNATSVPGWVAEPTKPPDNAPAADKKKYEEELAAYKKAMADGANLKAAASSSSRNFYSINFVWTLLAGFLVMFMQAGFALVETGLCRGKNAAHTMSMNFLVYGLGMIGFFVCGFAFMCGGANGTPIGGPAQLGGVPVLDRMLTVGDGWGIIGKTGFFLAGNTYDAATAVWFLFMMVFMDTTATIPTGALAERWTFKSFFIFSLFVGGVIYPIYGCWVWGGGWLAQLGMKAGLGHGAVDFAGSGVVHLQGGTIALITAILLGPRIDKYDENGKPKPILGHNIPMVMLGTFILAFGWFGFNAGSSLAGTDGRIGIIATNTMLASASGAVATCLYMWSRYGKPDPSMMCNGMLAGLVAITAPCAYVTPVSAFLIGAVSGVLVVWSVFFWEKRGIDDPVGAISVHGVNGLWGLLALGLLADGTYGAGVNGVHLIAKGAGGMSGWSDVHAVNDISKLPEGFSEIGVTGLLYGNSRQFVAQVIDGLVNIAWNLLAAGLIFYAIGKVLGSNRVPPEVEIAGLDIPEMGAPGYPEYLTALAPENVPSSQIAEAKARIPQVAAAFRDGL
jgi:Amt family ammonium transporter